MPNFKLANSDIFAVNENFTEHNEIHSEQNEILYSAKYNIILSILIWNFSLTKLQINWQIQIPD